MGPHDPFARATKPTPLAPGEVVHPEDPVAMSASSAPLAWDRVAWQGFGIGVGLGLLALLTSPLAALGVASAGLVGALLALVLASAGQELPRLRRMLVAVLSEDRG